MRTLFTNATFFTANAAADTHEALVVDGDRIGFVGDEARARAAAGPGAAEIDLGGAFVTPGIIESHAHLIMFGESLGKAQLRDCGTLEEIRRALLEWRVANPDAARVLGVSWRFEAVGAGHPTAAMLDDLFPDIPVYLDANDLHSAWVNSAALAEMGITRDTPDPVGGEIARDAAGDATGLLYETAAMQYVWGFLERVTSDADRDAALDAAFAAYLAAGVTGAADMSMNEADLAAMRRRLDRDGELPFPVYGHWLLQPSGSPAGDLAQVARAAELLAELDGPWLRMVGVKFIMDGVIDACTAPMLAAYANGSNAEPIWSAEHVRPVAAAADAAGLQIAMHAIGDATSVIALDALEHCIAVNGDRPRRHRMEHLESITEASIARLAPLGITASMQPVHCDPAILDNWKAVLGDERAETGFPWAKIVASGARLALGTDAPTAPYAALPNLFIATTGGSAIDPELPPYHPERAFSAADGLIAQTRLAAEASRVEHETGQLAPGLAANFAVLDLNPLTAAPRELLAGSVLRTVVAGRTRYER